MNRYEYILKEAGLKATYQRMSILSVLEKMGHGNIDEVYEAVKETHPTISLATVYKNILTMVENGVITEVPISGEKSKYELSKDEHIHMVCKRCGSVEDVSMSSDIHSDIDKVVADNSFEADTAQINIYGICRECKSA